tara:strand:- start:1797 stop:3080 length:1284 start_codon:yes stop_codon:yes gene_type:complete
MNDYKKKSNEFDKKLADAHNNITLNTQTYNIVVYFSIISCGLIILFKDFFLNALGISSNINAKHYLLLYLLLFLLALILIKILLNYLLWDNNYNNLGKDVSILKSRCSYQPKISQIKPQLLDLNPNTNENIDLFIRDFYWPSIYRPYISLNGTTEFESLLTLENNLEMGFRAIGLEIKESNNKITIGNSLDIGECFKKIKTTLYNNDLPIVLFFELSYGDSSAYHQQLYDNINKYFGDKLLFIQQGFNGYGGKFILPNIPIKSTLGKYIIVLNTYPTSNSNLNSITNGVIADNYQLIKKINYTKTEQENGIEHDVIDTQKFIHDNQTFITATVPSGNPDVNLLNANSFGVQFCFLDAKVYKGLTSNNTNNSIKFFINKKQTLVTKPPDQRFFPSKKMTIIKQNTALSYKPVKIDNMNGFIPHGSSFF